MPDESNAPAEGVKITFLGATVEKFNCGFGFNSSPSVANITLVEDFDGGDDFDVDLFGPETIDSQLKAGTGGEAYQSGNPGTFAEFTL